MPLDCTNYVEPLTDTEQEAKADLHRWLDRFPETVPALLEAVREGRMHGKEYRGPCRCVIGTILFDETPSPAGDRQWIRGMRTIRTQVLQKRGWSDLEEFVWRIHPGDTPSNSPVMAHLERWIMEWPG